MEWGCPQCGRYTVSHPHGPVVVLTAEPDSVHVPGAGFPPAPEDLETLTAFDQEWLRRHELAW